MIDHKPHNIVNFIDDATVNFTACITAANVCLECLKCLQNATRCLQNAFKQF